MSLRIFTTPPLSSRHLPLPPLNANIHAGVLPALVLPNLMRLQNANVDNLVNRCFAMLPEFGAFSDGIFGGESGLAGKTNSAPLFPRGLSMTNLPAEADGTADSTVSEGTEGGGPYFPHNCCQHIVLIIVTLLVKNIFFSNFNGVDLLCSILAD